MTQKRLTPLGLDGLVLYDIDDESGRNPQERPFPFLPTIDPATFRAQHLTDWTTPVVVYRAVGKYRESDLRAWLEAQDADHALTVFVGASSRHSSRRPRWSAPRAVGADHDPICGSGASRFQNGTPAGAKSICA